MLELMLRSGVPILGVTTTDTLNYVEMIKAQTDREVVFEQCVSPNDLNKLADGTVLVTHEVTEELELWYHDLLENEAVLLLVNHEYDNPLIVDCGELPTHDSLMIKELDQARLLEEAREIMPVLRGMTPKDMQETLRITQTRDGKIDRQGIMATKSMMQPPITGLPEISTEMDCYYPESELEGWLKERADIFINSEVQQLVPRGVILDGPPGTGKSLAAKRIAGRLECPLYLLNFGGMLDKWQGEAEKNLRTALAKVDAEEPCVLLIDEVEKLFASTGDDAGTSQRMLAQLLWWLQEHKSRVFTVMTTNDIGAIPPEVYRDGRIDKRLTLEGIEEGQAATLGKAIVDHLAPGLVKMGGIKNSLKSLFKEAVKTKIPQATVVRHIYDLIIRKQSK